MLVALLFRKLIKQGHLSVIDAAGALHRFGDSEKGPAVTIQLHDRSLHWRLFVNPRLHAGEAYMNGRLTVEVGSLYDFLDLIGLNAGCGTLNELDRWWTRLRLCWRRLALANGLGRARRNVAHHYDLSDQLYDLFLDRNRQYSCAYFEAPRLGLDEAQVAKMRHITSKLVPTPGLRVLDIGAGWGGLAAYLAEVGELDVTGITLSERQLSYARSLSRERGLEGHVRFQLCDYRAVTGSYDRVVSVGMFEHVGPPNYERFFAKIAALLKPDGIALVHTIAVLDEPYPTNPWLRKYIFPGGYSPALSEILPAIERAGLQVTDVEILRLHYAETLRHWRRRFLANRQQAGALYDERFCRMWEFYLAGCEVAFRRQGHVVAQIQLARSTDAVPITRGYITDWEDRQRARDHGWAEPVHLVNQ